MRFIAETIQQTCPSLTLHYRCLSQAIIRKLVNPPEDSIDFT